LAVEKRKVEESVFWGVWGHWGSFPGEELGPSAIGAGYSLMDVRAQGTTLRGTLDV